MVTGPSAGTYMKLCSQFSPKGAVQNQSVHQIGELAGIPVFKAPQSIIPTNEVLTVKLSRLFETKVSKAA